MAKILAQQLTHSNHYKESVEGVVLTKRKIPNEKQKPSANPK